MGAAVTKGPTGEVFDWTLRPGYNPRVTKAAQTLVRMLETLPEPAQDRVVETLAALIEEAQSEERWSDLLSRKSQGLAAAARRAREEIAAGKSSPMDYDKL